MITHTEPQEVPNEPPVKVWDNTKEIVITIIALLVVIGFAIWLNYRSKTQENEEGNNHIN